MKTISYKGKIINDTTERIRLSTIKGLKGYKIKQFQIFPKSPGVEHYEATLKIYSIEQTSQDATVDFSDDTLLAVGYYQDDNAKHYPSSQTVVFDNVKFNQDIYVTYVGTDGATADMNYYIELEQMTLSDLEATMATLKDIRAIES